MTQVISTEEELYAGIEKLGMEAGWHRRQPALWPAPRETFVPTLWKYEEIKPLLTAAGSLVSTEFAERRNVTMRNPAPGNPYSTVRTLVAAYQMIRPGETAKAHRHTANALRLILEGTGTFTVVNGTRVEMRPGDVLLTPNWAWHSHESAGGDDCYWLDFLDVPLVHLLEPMFFEHHPDGVEPDPVDVAESAIAFRWEDTVSRLASAAADPTGVASRQVQLGGPALDTIRLDMQQLDAGFKSRTVRTTANAIFAVAKGSGRTTISGTDFAWSFGDIIALPAWRPYQHHADTEAVLLRVSDEPVLDAVGWLRTELA